jgi:hypothetical protein
MSTNPQAGPKLDHGLQFRSLLVVSLAVIHLNMTISTGKGAKWSHTG